MSSARERQYRGAPGVSGSSLSVLELRCVGWITTNPCAAQKFTRGAYPFSEERWFEGPCPCERRMTGRSLPVTGAETRTSRSTARPGDGSTTGLTDRTGAGEPKASTAWVDSLNAHVRSRSMRWPPP